MFLYWLRSFDRDSKPTNIAILVARRRENERDKKSWKKQNY
jgi:hypothetical protein